MKEDIICAGFGGQGIMMLGKLIAYSAMRKKYYVTWMPSYGAEVRGGTAHCMVTIADQEIGSPVVSLCDTAVIMNKPSLAKFAKNVRPKGTLIINSSLVEDPVRRKDLNVLRIPFTDIAHSVGDVRVANIVVLGMYMAQKKIFTKDIVSKGIRIAFSGNQKIVDLNLKALREGIKLA